MADPFLEVRPDESLPKQEESILEFWDKHQIFEKSLEITQRGPQFTFYDGPPFATGLPHYGHLLAGILKDIVPRYWTMKGYNVPRVFGWDCHGVPVEFELNKELDIKSRAQVLELGVAQYNEGCRSIVNRYTKEWEVVVRRIGRWVDMKNAYRTMDISFMQSVWWVFKQLWDKGLIYEGFKVVPYSLGISTVLSNFEASQNYKMVQDPSLIVAFRSLTRPAVSYLAWTTTPWTLPSNLAIAISPTLTYVQVASGVSGESWIVAEGRLQFLRDQLKKDLPVESQWMGSDLLGDKYEPLFPYFKDYESRGAFRLLASDHVTLDAGTGLVHTAPGFGEDDFEVGRRSGLPPLAPVDNDGKHTIEISDFAGYEVFESNRLVIAHLKDKGNLVHQDTLVHSYPHCERTEARLIYRAVSSWFVKVEAFKDIILRSNLQTSWVPETLRDGRFGNWVENARDWAISRSRFWGTPLPVWRNEDGETVCIGSVKELEDLSGVKGIKDLHSHFVDSIEIPSRQGGAPLKRVEGVLDCWFESGAMPMAQCGYPFDEKNKQRFEQGFPADFIAEGLDQTRGWFYTLMVIASALWEKPAFQHVIVNGLVLAEDGKKMSKRLRNYPDPSLVLEKYGADALRLYLMDSPVVKAQDLRFSEKGVSDIVRRILLRWWNAYGFFVTYANADGFIPRGLDEAGLQPEDFRLLDRWILSRLSDLTATVHREMQAYRLYSVVPALLKFIDDLTNIYIRFNRREFWQEGMPKSKLAAFETMYRVLWDLSHLMAPWTPFLAESMYQNLRRVRPDAPLSVHLGAQPQSENRFDTETLEKTMPVLLDLIELGRSIRQQAKIKTKIPLPMATVFHQDSGVLEALRQLEPYWLDELNVQQVVYRTDEDAVVRRSTRASYARLGKRLGARMKEAAERLSSLSPDELSILEAGGEIAWHGELFTREDIETRRELLADPAVAASSQYIALILDTRVDTQALAEGVAREVIRRIQTARKNAQLRVEQRIHLHLGADGELGAIIQKFRSKIDEEVLCIGELAGSGVSYKESFELDEGVLEVGLRVADGDV